MNIVMIGLNNAGVMTQLCQAINKYTPHKARFYDDQAQTYLNYPRDLTNNTLPKAMVEADVIHWHSQESLQLKPHYMKYVQRKTIQVKHFHGTDLRSGFTPNAKIKQYFVTTPDLLWYLPEATYLPNPIDVESFQMVEQTDDPIVCQASAVTIKIEDYQKLIRPSPWYKTESDQHTLKHADFFETTMQKSSIKWKSIKQLSWKDCIKEKAKCQIVFDQIYLGAYGLNAIESMAMGQPVLVRIAPETYEFYPTMPIVLNIDENSFEYVLSNLVNDIAMRRAFAKQGRKFVTEHHDAKVVVKDYIRELEKWLK